MVGEFKYEIKKDFGGFGNGKWQKHLCLISYNGAEPKLDIRAWNEDMSKMDKGVTLTKDEAYDLMLLLEDALAWEGDKGKKDA